MQQVVFVTYGDRDDGSDNDDEGDDDDHGDGDDGDGDEDKAAPFSIVVKPQAGFDRDERPAAQQEQNLMLHAAVLWEGLCNHTNTNTQIHKCTNIQICKYTNTLWHGLNEIQIQMLTNAD